MCFIQFCQTKVAQIYNYYPGCLQLVPVPRDVRPGHALRDDDPHQLVLSLRGPGQLLQQLCCHVGEDNLQLAGRGNLSLDSDSSSCASGQGLWILRGRRNTSLGVTQSILEMLQQIEFIHLDNFNKNGHI